MLCSLKNEGHYSFIEYAILCIHVLPRVTLLIKRNSDVNGDIFFQTRLIDVINFSYFFYEEGFS